VSEGDGRHIDPRAGVLEGEGAGQQVEQSGHEAGRMPFSVWAETPGRPSPEGATYYGRPAIKEPVWMWAVPAYFYAGGAAGAAASLGAIAQGAGGGRLRRLVTRCRLIAAGGILAGTALLVYDLGRPSRFGNMLRVFRPTSPMNLGSWALAAAGPLASASAVFAWSGPGPRLAGDLAGVGAGLLGPPLTAYTGVLLSNTAVPLWQATRRSLPPLFAASSVASAASLLDLVDLDGPEERVVRRFGLLGKAAELAATVAVEREANRVERVGRPLREGLGGALWRAAKGLTAASLVVSALPGSSRRRRVAAGIMGTLGSVAVRFAVFHAGKASARDPRATFDQQRAGRGAAEVDGSARQPAVDAGP
jgi:formate-dependent nitrite reductase membrane component NrfD